MIKILILIKFENDFKNSNVEVIIIKDENNLKIILKKI